MSEAATIDQRKASRRGRFRRCERGAAAVEFAIVAPVFLGLMFATFEVGWFYFVNSQIDSATVEAARLIRTGRAQKENFDKQEFYDAVCGKLTVEVRRFTSFNQLATDNSSIVCSDDAETLIAGLPYDPGTDNDIVRLRICYLYQTLNPALGVNLSDRANGKRRLYGTFVSRNEPFTSGI
jgi:hypothetical protein